MTPDPTTTTTPAGGPARPPVPHRLASTLLGLLPALVLLGGATLLVASWWDELPDPIATHWGPDGVDGFGDAATNLTLLVLVFAAIAVGMWLIAVLGGRDAAHRRIGVGMAAGSGAFGAVLVAGVADAQRGLADAALAGDIDGAVLLAAGAGLALGAVAAWAVPGDARQPAAGSPVGGARLPLGPHERAAWSGRATGPAVLAAGAGGALLSGGLALGLGMPGLLVVTLAMSLLVATAGLLTVTVDARGLVVRSALGWPRTRVPLEEVVAAREVEVRPLPVFGGWGCRIGRGGRSGFVVRRGPAIEVERTGGRVLVVTVDDAATGAALLATLAERARPAARL
jgi:hypothetical protein